jgi:rfaE bifunctional protein kinase chain/domain
MLSDLTTTRLADGLPDLRGKRVLVVGDVMLDHYQQGKVERISPEAPVPVVQVEKEEYRLGGAGNVAANINGLSGKAYLLGCAGRDSARDKLAELLRSQGVGFGLIDDPAWRTTLKTRVLADGQQVVRVDQELVEDRGGGGRQEFKDQVLKLLPEFEVLILSDYGKGALDEQLLDSVRSLAKRHQVKVLIDPKARNFDHYLAPYLITPNRREAAERTQMSIKGQKEIIAAGYRLKEMHQCANLLITLGAKGMVLFFENQEVWHLPTSGKKVFDVTGAGDTVVAVTGLALAAGKDLALACALANHAAGLVVGKVGAANISLEELGQGLRQGRGLVFNKWV